MSGFVGDLSSKQQANLDQFRERVKDVITSKHDDHELLRWLRARSWDLNKAEKMFRDHLDWEKANDIENILQWEVPEVLSKYFPGGYHGVDNDGYPIWFRVAEYVFQVMYPKLSKKFGKTIDELVIVLDCQGLDTRFLWKPVIDLCISLLKQLEANYPETVRAIYVINTPTLFNVAYNLLKPFLSEHTKTKIKVCGKDPQDWLKTLQTNIALDQIPAFWGGTATGANGDVTCGIINKGDVPESFYRLKALKEAADMSKFTQLNVRKGSSAQLEFEVTKPNSMLTWNYWTEGKDIGFGIFKKTGDERQKAADMEEVMESKRVNSHMIPENGSFKCEDPGTYVVRFDNTYSWVNAKDVSYQIEVLDPTADLETVSTSL
ncbi:hypothetical protein CAPTEDRAFT_187622 [Capitella teleta]|uniref:CRAL-TRIO domain-containing protein n=1 Tax=Capitella teleta TaxID=283909 RepID=R7UDH4_CAPTE|nr:hypothetical protein CAPTEDRAFT_187622 [Capitella teleta]|eukprot:ELU04161.1 hypothetical protein CAPTEDRAFT_187622 [Capitella teleta]